MSEVHRSVDLPYELDDVWDALTDNEQLAEWLETDVELDPRPGGDVRTPERQGVVEESEPGRRLVFRWWPVAGGAREASTVELDLQEIPGGTRLTVVEWQSASPIHVNFATRKRTVPFGFHPPRAMVGTRR